MNWFYVKNGAQAGPVDEVELDRLAKTGEIAPGTLVWQQGMGAWQPYSEARTLSTTSPTATQAVCVECHKTLEKDSMIRHGDAWVCAECKPLFLQKLSEGVEVRTGAMHYAGFWIRALAFFIDSIVLGIVIAVPMIAIFAAVGFNNQQDSGAFVILQVSMQLLQFVASAAYSIFFVGKFGATPGQMALKLKVVDASGARFGYGRATGRFFAKILSMLICYIGCIMAAFDDEKRALHDRICNTRVIYK